MNKSIRAIIPLAVLCYIWFMPVPEGLTKPAMHFVGIFLAVILALILEPLPNAAVGLIGCTLAGAMQLVPLAEKSIAAIATAAKDGTAVVLPTFSASNLTPAFNWTVSGFVDSTVWLIFIAYMFALGYEKTGLGKRIALILIAKLGNKALGLGYASALSDGILAPFIPSNTARAAGTVYPVIKNIPVMYNSLPDNEPRKIGAYLMWTCFATTCVTSSLFLTGLAPNLAVFSVINSSLKGMGMAEAGTVEWLNWFWCLAPAGILLFILVPWLTYVIYPPTQKEFPEAPKWAAGELDKLGPTTTKEWLMLCMALLALIGWIFGASYLNATMVGLVVVCLMVLFNIVTWDDVTANKGAWNTFVWFATLVGLAGGLARVGFLTWVGNYFKGYLEGVSPAMLIFGLLALFYFIHYFFASLTAHTNAVVPMFVAIAVAVPGLKLNMPLFAMILAGSLGIMGVLTPYATGPAPIYYNTGYINKATFWFFGTLYGVIFFAVYAVAAMYWFPVILGPIVMP